MKRTSLFSSPKPGVYRAVTDSVDVLVIGAGVIGLAVAREFAMQGREVVSVEKASAIGTGTSSRNSEVIHAGLYYEPGSLKARLCVEGKKLIYDYCATHSAKARQIGKLILAQSESELPKLYEIQKRAINNGVFGLEILNAVQVEKIEPEIQCVGALLSPSTGIIDSQQFMLSLQAEAQSYGAIFALQTTAVAGKPIANGIEVELLDAHGGKTQLHCRDVINCAGHGAHDVAMALTGGAPAQFPQHFLAKGSYCNVSGALPFKHLIYPVPVPGALGIHVTLDMQGRVRLGPNIEWITVEDYSLSETIISEFRSASEGFWPGVREREISPAYCGIRSKISGPNDPPADFFIEPCHSVGAARLINLFGIESPGLTASLAIASHVSQITKCVV